MGDNCVLAGQVGLVNHVRLGDEVLVTAGTGVPNDVPSGRKISGAPAIDNRQWLRCLAVFKRLPELNKRVRDVERKLASAEGDPD